MSRWCPPLPFRDRRHDEGSGTVWALVAVTLLMGAAALVTTRGLVAVQRHQAAAVADEAALAAAGRLGAGPTTACLTASVVARASGASVVSCSASPDRSVSVVIELPPSRRLGWLLGGLPPVRVGARAGRSPPITPGPRSPMRG